MSSGSEDKEPEMRHIIVFQFREITPTYLYKKTGNLVKKLLKILVIFI